MPVIKLIKKTKLPRISFLFFVIALGAIIILVWSYATPSTSETVVEPFTEFTKSDCEMPCWLGIQIGQTTLREAETLLASLGYDFETRPKHIGGSAVYARQYGWDNPMTIRLSPPEFLYVEMTMDSKNIVEGIFFSSDVCPASWFSTYDMPDYLVDRGNSLRAEYWDLGMGISFSNPTYSSIGLGITIDVTKLEQAAQNNRFPQDVSPYWNPDCISDSER